MTITATLRNTNNLHAPRSIIVQRYPCTSTRPTHYRAKLSDQDPRDKAFRLSIGAIPTTSETTTAEAAFVAAEFAKTLSWPVGPFFVVNAGPNLWVFSQVSAKTLAFEIENKDFVVAA